MYNPIKNKEKKDFYLRKIRKFIGFVELLMIQNDNNISII